MLVLVTGLPGSGKTLFTIDWLIKKAEKEGRQVYYSGITDLKLPWIEHDPEKWMELPPNSIIVIDEAQRIFRPRASGAKVPPHVEQLETHRHRGIDIVVITQHPMLLDGNLRRLTGLHFHVVRKWGRQSSTIHEFPEVRDNPDKNRKDSQKRNFSYPKKVFTLYKSAEVHTHKVRIPTFYYVLAGVLILLSLAIYRFYSSVSKRVTAPVAVQTATAPPGQALPGQPLRVGAAPAAPQPPDWWQSQQPRIDGMAHTAPAYDALTAPRQIPYPAACVASRTRCQCYTQQATPLQMRDDQCRQIVKHGIYMPWAEPSQPAASGTLQAQAAPLTNRTVHVQ